MCCGKTAEPEPHKRVDGSDFRVDHEVVNPHTKVVEGGHG